MNLLSATDQGDGPAVLLIHGFPFHRGLWNEFVPLLTPRLRVITIDLPGFGQSPMLEGSFAISQVADALLSFISDKKLQQIHIVGHSLGGYVALEMIRKEPSAFASLVLFHSTAYADSDEKKESRLKVVEFVKKNGPIPFTTGFIEPLFANSSHPAVEKVRAIAAEASAEAIIAYSLAMKDRSEQLKTLEIFKNPTMFIAGEKDPGIPIASIQKQALHCQKPQIEIFPEVGHMGMFEKAKETAGKISDFVSKSHT
jgi:pimeloyl-ACP methyl ester carboxylesterase